MTMEEPSPADSVADDPPSPPPVSDPQQQLPEEAAPPDVQQDAAIELDRLHEEMRFEDTPQSSSFDPSYGMSPAASPQPMAFAALEQPRVHREPAAVPSSRELKTLEDLYDAYSVGDGSHSLRIERKHPVRYGGQYIAGYLCDLTEQISMDEFARRFGGQVYNVSVRGPSRSNALDGDGLIQTRTLTTIQIRVPGIPVLTHEGSNGGEPMQSSQSYGLREDPRIALKRMDHSADALRRSEQREAELRREGRSSSNFSPEMVDRMTQMASERAHDARSASSEIIVDLREEKRRLGESCRDRDETIDKLRQQLVQVQTDVQQKLREEESRQVRELKSAQESTMSRTKDDHAATIQRMQQDHERRINEMTERSVRECASIRESESRERERLRDDSSRREKSGVDDINRRDQAFRDRENTLKDDFARREDAMRRDYEMRFQQLERSNKRDLDMIRSSESTKSHLAEQTAHMQANLHMSEIKRLTSSNVQAESARDEAQRELSRHTNKPLLQQVEETRSIADALGMLDKKDDEELDWKKGLIGVVRNLVDKAPDIAKGLGDAREQNRMAVARAQNASQHAQQRADVMRRRHHPAMQPMSAPPQQIQPQQRRVAPPPPPPGMAPQPRSWDAGPPEPHHVDLPPVPGGPPAVTSMASPPRPSAGVARVPAPPPFTGGPIPVEEPQPQPQPQESQDMAAPPMTPISQPPMAQDQPPGPDPAALVEAPPQPQAPPQAPLAPATEKITNEQVAEFSQQLEDAIASGLVTAKVFARKFIDEAGPDVTLTIINALGPDQLISAVNEQPGGESTAIVTRGGRKFVHELWEEARQLANEQLGQQPAQLQ